MAGIILHDQNLLQGLKSVCGICGFTSPDGDAHQILASMVQTLFHRGPDDEGLLVSRNFAFGHRRLAVIDLEGGAQPRFDEESGDTLVFNGEIYGYRQLAAKLRREGVELKDNSDTEVLFWLLRSRGVKKTLELIDGMFAFGYFEGKSRRLYLARDRFGEKPIFYGITNGSLVFASEIKAIRRHPAFSEIGIDRTAAHQFLTYEYQPGDVSGYEGVRKVKPGHFLVFEKGKTEIFSYWRPVIGCADPEIDEKQAIDRLEKLLDDSVCQRMVADVPVGLFLSGGVDSGLLAAILARQSHRITAFTVKMPNASYDETAVATKLAKHCGLPHQVVELSNKEMTEALETVGSMIDEPLADYSLLPTYLVCRAARQQMTVALGGDGGDELFAGYSSFKAYQFAKFMSCLPKISGKLLRCISDRILFSNTYMNPGFVLHQVSQGFGYPVDYQNVMWMSPFSEEEKQSLWCKEALPMDAKNLSFLPIDDVMTEEAPKDAVDRLIHQFTLTYLPEDVLSKVDRASMCNSLEVRAPYLSRAFAEFALSLPSRWKFNRGETKYILKKLAARYLPKDCVYRPKRGFGFPLAELLRGPFYMTVRDVLMDAGNPLAGWFERSVINKYLYQHKQGIRDHRKKLWALYILYLVASRKA